MKLIPNSASLDSVSRSSVRTVSACFAICLNATAVFAETWTMPTPYSDTNFHTENIRAFAAEVERLTDGELVIEVHPGGTLVAHAEIADAVWTCPAFVPPQVLV